MSASIDLTEPMIFTALGAFLTDVLPMDVEVIRGQVNRVPSPNVPDYVVMWPTMRRLLSTARVTATAAGPGPELDRNHYMTPMELSVQVDVHGPASASNAQMLVTLARTEYATAFFDARAEAVQMLAMEDPRQLAFETGEKQLEDRWVIGALLQANPVTTTVQQFADVVAIGLIEIDATYPPGDA